VGVPTSTAHSVGIADDATQPVKKTTPHAYKQNVSNSSMKLRGEKM
jgi:hypothetical protein